ncbi:EamA family transporter [Cupriavidus pauculus]|uniref:EamA family transporter n=1 Tax=Cupriavidus pauculus TaxID=82633 RepID=UPI001EE350F9|nr:EamA family transporter [Cupriavidus pauculus]
MAYGLWTSLLKRHPANQVAPFGLLVPVVGLLAGAAILKESLSTWQSIGIAWIAAALLFILVVSRRQA